jgi:hypothetical protein
MAVSSGMLTGNSSKGAGESDLKGSRCAHSPLLLPAVGEPQSLQNRSQDGIAFLEGLGLNIGTIVRLGGHSKPRTRSNPAGPNVGTYLVKAVAARVQAAANVEVKLNSKVCMRCHL